MSDALDHQLPLISAENKGSSPIASPAESDPVGRLDRLNRDLTTAVRLLHGIQKWGSDNAPDTRNARSALKQVYSAISKLPDELTTEVRSWLSSLEGELDNLESARARGFAAGLATALESNGIHLSGHLPLLQTAFFTLEVQDDIVRIWYGPQREHVRDVGKDAETTAKVVRDTLTRLKATAVEDGKFLELLYEAYLASVAGSSNKASGQRAKISATHLEMLIRKQNRSFMSDPRPQRLQEYSRMQFSYDLYRLKNRVLQDIEMHLFVATKSQTVQKADSLWVPSDANGAGALYSHIAFIKR